jgi:heme-degrading monooxygenase HmoA
MIVRTWRCVAPKHLPDGYITHFHQTVLPHLKVNDGFMGALLLRRETAEGMEFVVVTQWDSMDSIKKIAGDDHERAVVEPGDMEILISYDPTVAHYDVISSVA